MIFNLFKKKYGTGALIEVRPEEEKEKDCKFEETVATADPVNWVEKTEYRKFPIFNQNQSGSCVAMTLAKLLLILYWLKEQVFIKFSATHIYQRRANKPSSGMGGIDALDIASKGVTLEVLVPSQNMTDAQMDAAKIEKYKQEVGEVFKMGTPIILPTKDIDTVASVIQKTGKGVMVWFYFTYSEWSRNVPEIQNHSLNPYALTTCRHSVCAVDFTLYKGKKALIIDESWGLGSGINGQRIITEDFFKVRNFFAVYPMNFKFEEETTPKPQYQFNNNLEFGQINSEVVALQDILKWFGFFPINTASTGRYYSITAKAVLGWQKKFSVENLEELERLQGRYFGPKSRAKMNELLE